MQIFDQDLPVESSLLSALVGQVMEQETAGLFEVALSFDPLALSPELLIC
jgi:hypothetical protein